LILGVTNGVLLGSALPDALAELKALAKIIQSSVEQIEATVNTNSFTYPSPDSIFSPETEALRNVRVQFRRNPWVSNSVINRLLITS
jgi:hypothetical protein